MSSYMEVVTAKYAAGVSDYERVRWSLYIQGDVLYSYGRHFPLAYRKGDLYLINGDRYSQTTSRHQAYAIEGLKPNVQVPFSALNSAGVWPSEVEVVDYTSDRIWYACPITGREVYEVPAVDGSYRWVYRDTHEECPATYTRDDGEDEPYRGRWRHRLGSVVLRDPATGSHWLSGMDENEPDRLQKYFLCRLPRRSPTVEDAYASLAPKIVRDAWAEGVNVKRQGDVYLIPSDVDTRELPAPSEKWAPAFYETCRRCAGEGKREVGDLDPETGVLEPYAVTCRECGGKGKLPSTHVATEVRRNGKDYVRGTLRHRPDLRERGREPEHRMVTLGSVWHIAVPNRALESYTAAGGVD